MSMADRDGVIWFDGEMVPWRDAKVHVLTHTLHYGMGCFEGVRAYHAEQGTAIFALAAHTDRLLDSCKVLDMPIPYDKQTLMDAQVAAVRENELDSAYIRPMVFYNQSEEIIDSLLGGHLDIAIVVGKPTDDAPWLHVVDLAQPGVTREATGTIDPSRSLARLTFNGAETDPLAGARSALDVQRLIDWFSSSEAHTLIAGYKVDGEQLFYPVEK